MNASWVASRNKHYLLISLQVGSMLDSRIVSYPTHKRPAILIPCGNHATLEIMPIRVMILWFGPLYSINAMRHSILILLNLQLLSDAASKVLQSLCA